MSRCVQTFDWYCMCVDDALHGMASSRSAKFANCLHGILTSERAGLVLLVYSEIPWKISQLNVLPIKHRASSRLDHNSYCPSVSSVQIKSHFICHMQPE